LRVLGGSLGRVSAFPAPASSLTGTLSERLIDSMTLPSAEEPDNGFTVAEKSATRKLWAGYVNVYFE
jgi:hypothetical protein